MKTNNTYQNLGRQIGGLANTPLVRYGGSVPNGCSIFIKDETGNFGGSHYGRVMHALIGDAYQSGRLKQGQPIMETSSGEAGISCVQIGRALGHDDVYIIIPDGPTTKKRRERIQHLGGKVILTPAEEYIGGFTKDRIVDALRTTGAYFLNHSMGKWDASRGQYHNNEVTLRSLEGIARETLELVRPDIFIAGLGNGSSLVGPGRVFKADNSSIRIVGIKPYKSGGSEATGLINQNGVERKIPFPHLIDAKELMDAVYQFSSRKMDVESGRRLDLPHWDDPRIVGVEKFGVTTRAWLAVALEEAAKAEPGSTIVGIGYNLAANDDPL